MSTDLVQERVVARICEYSGKTKEEVNLETRFVEDLGFDSLDMAETVMQLEEEFDIELPDNVAENIKTIGQAVEYIATASNKTE